MHVFDLIGRSIPLIRAHVLFGYSAADSRPLLGKIRRKLDAMPWRFQAEPGDTLAFDRLQIFGSCFLRPGTDQPRLSHCTPCFRLMQQHGIKWSPGISGVDHAQAPSPPRGHHFLMPTPGKTECFDLVRQHSLRNNLEKPNRAAGGFTKPQTFHPGHRLRSASQV